MVQNSNGIVEQRTNRQLVCNYKEANSIKYDFMARPICIFATTMIQTFSRHISMHQYFDILFNTDSEITSVILTRR